MADWDLSHEFTGNFIHDGVYPGNSLILWDDPIEVWDNEAYRDFLKKVDRGLPCTFQYRPYLSDRDYEIRYDGKVIKFPLTEGKYYIQDLKLDATDPEVMKRMYRIHQSVDDAVAVVVEYECGLSEL